MDDDELPNCDKSDEFELEEDKEVIPDDMDEDCKDESTEVSPDTKPIINALIEGMGPGKWYIIERKQKKQDCTRRVFLSNSKRAYCDCLEVFSYGTPCRHILRALLLEQENVWSEGEPL